MVKNKFLFSMLCLFLPSSRIKNKILSIFGAVISKDAIIGHSYIYTRRFIIENKAKIGSFNYINNEEVFMKEESYIQSANFIVGPFKLYLSKKSAIGNRNEIRRISRPICWGRSILRLGENSKITSQHSIDCCRPIYIGDNSIIAGKYTQLWTHGYMHSNNGVDRVRIDGCIKIGSNVYIGSSSLINCGIKIEDAITIGSHSSVSKSLFEPGLYVSQKLRYIQRDYDNVLLKYPTVNSSNIPEKVVNKKCI